MPRELYARAVQNWTLVPKACRTTGATVVTRSAKAHAMQTSEEGSIVNTNQTAPRGRSPMPKIYLETDSERLFKTSAATQIAVFQRLWEFAALTKMRRAFLRPSCSQMLSSVEKRADRRTSSLVIPRPTKNYGLVIPSHIRCILAS
jgi:hypothetical protein